ncbi:ankyrin [Wilcoxina mikolae CBS 423.85]|nr:ankyrin [Wilcoxina mikolae CBS 423.85]
MDPVSIIGLTKGICQLISVTTKVYGYLNTVKNASSERTDLFQEVSHLMPIISDLRTLVETSDANDPCITGILQLAGHMEKVTIAMEGLKEKLKPGKNRRNTIGKSIVWGLTKEDVKEIVGMLERFKTLTGLALQKDLLNLSRAIKDDVVGISKDVKELQNSLVTQATQKSNEDRTKVAKWLSPLNFFQTQNNILSGRHTGTGQWLLDSSMFGDWVDGQGQTLWCPGIPGAGKTVLASIIVNHLRTQFKSNTNVAITCIYCMYKDKEQTPTNIIGSICKQLIQTSAILPDSAAELYRYHTTLDTRPSYEEISRVLRVMLNSYHKVFVVLDALDEYSNENSPASLIAERQLLQPNINLLVTSRPNDTIGRLFEGKPRLEIRAHDEDIQSYVGGRIDAEDRLSRHIRKRPDLRTEIAETIVRNSKKQFLLARLHMDSLATKNNLKDVRTALKTLPDGLDATYDDALQRIEGQNQDDRSLAHRVLSWISHVTRPLSVKELQTALAIELDESEFDEENMPDEELLTSLCAGLVVVEEESKLVRLVHYTTEEFFQRCRTKRFPGAHKSIALHCITYLSYDVFAEGPCVDYAAMRHREEEFFLFFYAANNWGHHVREAPEQFVIEQVLELLRQPSIAQSAVQGLQVYQYEYRGLMGYCQDFFGSAELWVAAYFGLVKCCQRMLENGYNIETVTGFGETAFHGAAETGQTAVIQLLLDSNANIEVRDRHSRTPLLVAARQGYEDVVRLLWENGADINCRCGIGETPLGPISIRRIRRIEMVLYFIGLLTEVTRASFVYFSMPVQTLQLGPSWG